MNNQTAGPGEELAQWRKAQGLTQEAAAERLGISQEFLSQLENCDSKERRKTPGLKLAAIIERIAGVRATSWIPVEEQEGAA